MNPDFSPIEYIGPRGKKRGRFGGTRAGGWLLLILALGIAACFLRPLLPSLHKQQMAPNILLEKKTIADLREADTVATRLAAAALNRIREVEAAAASLPGPSDQSADLVLHSYQAVGIDLRELIKEDMNRALRYYPNPSRPPHADAGLVHRDVPNLQRFFARWGKALHTRKRETEFEIGDVVVWEHPSSLQTPVNRVMGIIVPGPDKRSDERWVVREDAGRLQWTSRIFDHEIVGHYRYTPVSDEVARLEMAGVAAP